MPWPGSYSWETARKGAPRDMYLSLTSIDYGALLQQYRPLMKYDYNESYFADNAREILDSLDTKLMRHYEPSAPEWESYAPSGNRLLADHSGSAEPLSVDALQMHYPGELPS